MVAKLDKIFDLATKNSIFKHKSILQSNYTPDTIPHRDKEIEQIAAILAPSLKGERPSNLFVYGRTGTGKTVSVQYVRDELLKRVKDSKGLKIEYLNCKLRKVSDTEYRILAEFIKKLGAQVPATGLPTDAVYNKFIEIIDREKQLLIMVLDEIDQIIKKIPESSNFLYNLTRLNTELKNAQICLVGISNDLRFLDNLDPRVRSSLSEEEIVFQSYNALQLQDILRERTEEAFYKEAISDGVVEKCAAFAARDHGDARRALDLLRVAGEVAEREGCGKIELRHIDLANSKIERDKILDTIESEPKQFQLTLLAIMELLEKNEKIFTGDVYRAYKELCERTRTEGLTQRRVSSIISEFDMSGLINARDISRGKYGKTREIRSAIPKQIEEQAKNILIESLSL